MAVKDTPEERSEKIRGLFSELGEVYARAAAIAPSPITDSQTCAKLTEERRKASAIIQSIRQIQGL